jgi:5'-nucleotidase
MINVNVPATPPDGVEVARLGRRVYYDKLEPRGDIADDGSGHYILYNAEPGFHDEPGTDVAAVAAGRIAVTPLHLDLTLHGSIAALDEAKLDRMLDQ